jgi:hypothetical protein
MRTVKYFKSGILFLVAGLLFLLNSCSSDEEIRLDSPEGKCSIQFILNDGQPYYRVFRDNRIIIDKSALGFELKDARPLLAGFKMESASMSSSRERWEPVWGQRNRMRNNNHQLLVVLREKSEPYRELHLEFKAFDDGVGFRYIIPEQENLQKLEITREISEFQFPGEMSAWWAGGEDGNNDFSCRNTPLSAMELANTPLILEGDDSLFVRMHEASLLDYPEMRLKRSDENPLMLINNPVPWPDGVIAKVAIPFKSPWRTIQIADEAGMLIESSLILNINEPSQMEDASWVRLMKSGEAPVFVINDALTDSVLAHYESLGIRAIRAKFVDIGSMEGQLPGSQARVDQMTRLVEKAAEHKIMVYADETVKASGLERTWPNFICYEGNWYDDLTPGNQVQSTTAGQLAMMVVNFNPYQWIGGLSENYQEDAALSFIRELPVDWDDIRVLNAKIGDYVTIARKKKDAWYLGSVTDENPREFTFTLDFLDEKLSYEMISYADDTAADRLQNPSAYFFEKKQVKKDDEIMVKLATGGGQAAAIRPVD